MECEKARPCRAGWTEWAHARCAAPPPTPAPPRPGGHGRILLRAMVQAARGRGACRVFLEVRPSNPAAIALYQDEGFNEIGRRPRYYPAANNGREDAIVMAMELLGD